jgi:iron-sulfur cluster assembly protein
MIKVTENAKTQALQLMRDDGNEGYVISVGVRGGGC